jgi:rhamnose utilization protein RhaD (predicted bifunctional aldolase and dehydrogenase)/NAD(P)-dependent dehydrogenase (short-subunit alcohol dehydrogenase family)
MESRWDDAEAAGQDGDLGLRVYSSRLIGQDRSLVLYGGGNTSVKLRRTTLFGEPEDLLFIKGTGFSLDTISESGFAPVRLTDLTALAGLPRLSDLEMTRQLRLATVDPAAPAPSVEAILHAILPFKFVDHAHADSVIALTNTPSGTAHLEAAYGSRVLVVPYVMPGFELSRSVAQLLAGGLGPEVTGLILMGHGLFSFGGTARESYERLIDLVTIAEDYLRRHDAWDLPAPPPAPARASDAQLLAGLRARASALAGHPMLLSQRSDDLVLAFARRDDVARLSQQGPATPDHVIRTKRVPLLGQDLDAYAERYREYFTREAADHPAGGELRMLDPAPRLLLDPDLGLCAIGRTAGAVAAAAEIYHHTIEIILRAEALERWQALTPAQIFEVEYWDLEQAKLRQEGPAAELTGEIALVTGAASGIGRACAQALARAGAAVCGLDRDQRVTELLPGPGYLGITCDVTVSDQVEGAIERVVREFGGIDSMVLSAGVFPSSAPISALSAKTWADTFAVNADSALILMRAAYPYLCLAPRGGRVVVIASKNVPAPGPGAAAYSASKAAITQLARVAALEWGKDGIRVNVLHPNAVFDTGLWSEEVISERAAAYGISPAEYRTRNVLRTEVRSADVAGLATAMCGPLFSRVTGAQLPVDGGDDRVI